MRWVDGAYSWDWDHIQTMMVTVEQAAAALGVELTWGGAWDRKRISQMSRDFIMEKDQYVARRRARGLDAHPDGAHLQRITRSPSSLPELDSLAA